VPTRSAGDGKGLSFGPVKAQLLGPFSVRQGELVAGPWPRPSARRLCQLTLVSPSRRIGRVVACEQLFPKLGALGAGEALSKAISMARSALAALGDLGPGLLKADRALIWFDGALDVDLEAHTQALRRAIALSPGPLRDQALVAALDEKGTLLEDEPYAEWAVGPREDLGDLRQEARLSLARDRARGIGWPDAQAVARAWEDCLSYRPTCEEAACALMRLYAAQEDQALVERHYRRCQSALAALGLRPSLALDEVYVAVTQRAPRLTATASLSPDRPVAATALDEERRLVSIFFAELSAPAEASEKLGTEELGELVGGALNNAVAEVEALGGVITSLSGTGLCALFGAPVSHEATPNGRCGPPSWP
jgi:DNA-binding SARP family transcriptional activator